MPSSEATELSERRLLVLAVLTAAVAQALLLSVLLPALKEGQLVDIDCYTRLVRVRELHATGAWYDPLEARANAPFGVTSHWTRPLDVLLIAGTAVLAPFVGFDRGLHWWGVVISPLLYLLTAWVLVWAVRPLLSPSARFLMLLTFPTQLVMLMDSAPGMADHHALQLLIVATTLGVTLRMFQQPSQPARALAAGAILALGLWVSTEFFLVILLCVSALGLGWVLHGGNRSSRNAWHALGLAAGMVLALLLERAPSNLLSIESDRISVMHLLPCVACLAFWTLVSATRMGSRAWSLRGRLIVAAVVAIPIGGVLSWVAGGALTVAARISDPYVAPFYVMRTLLPTDLATSARFLVSLGTSVLAVPFLLVITRRVRASASSESWLLLTILGVGQSVAALRLARLVGYAELLLLIPVGALAAELLASVAARPSRPWRVALVPLATVGLLIGPLAIGACLIAWFPTSAGDNVNPFRPDDLHSLYPLLNARPGLGEQPLTILSPPGDGPELLYRTSHLTVAYPQHRGVDSIRDCLTFYDTPDERVAHSIVSQRGVELVIMPVDTPWQDRLPIKERPFIARCVDGDCPAWLRPIRAEQADMARVSLFAVIDEL